jgi:hypothetical protein
MQCGHRGFHTISSSYDLGTRVLTFFRRCDDCGARLTEVGQLEYEPRFVATPTERRVASRIIAPPPTISRGVTTIERRPKISQKAGIRDADDGADHHFGRPCDCMEGTGYRLMTRPNAPSHRPGGGRVRHALTLRFDDFGWESLELEAQRDSETLGELLSRAAAYFEAERPTRRAAMRAPGFKPGGRGVPREIRLEVNRDCWVGLQGEAGRQGVPLERLLEHAALLYLADVDSGRVANRVLGCAGDGDEP